MRIDTHSGKNWLIKIVLTSLPFDILSVLILGCSSLFAAAPPEVTLASEAKAVHPIIIRESASERVRAAAETLADYLYRMSGAKFQISAGDGRAGIALGLASDFPSLKLGVDFNIKDPQLREDYLLRTHDSGIFLIGATDLAVENAVWDLLYRLGYRHYFPGKNWEIIPRNANLKIAADTFERPDYSFRRVWYGYGTWSENARETELWRSHNRMQVAFNVNCTHTYGTIIKNLSEKFAQHPEYLSNIDGKPTNKLNIANPDLRRLVVQWALDKMEKDPDMEVLALDPSDGGGWGQSKEEMALGPVSNRVVMLANEVAEAINERFAEKYGRKYVGIYAYNEHAMPPTIKVNPNVMVLIATAFNKSGLSLEQLVEGWQKQGATTGIREYYNVITGSQDLPGKAPGSQLGIISVNIPKYHKLGARFLSAEGGDGWGSCGLGYYLASRFTWDVKEADKAKEIQKDFLEKSFGEAKEPMTRFYAMLIPPTFNSESSIGRMYRALDEARNLTKDPGTLSRINDLLIYTRYVDIKTQYNSRQSPRPSPEQKIQSFERMVRFLYRARQSHMVHLQGLWRDMPRRDKVLDANLPKEGRFNTKEGGNSWKSSDPITNAELDQWLKEGISSHKIVDFEPVSFSRNLEPATALSIQEKPCLNASYYIRTNIFYTWVAPGQESIRFRATMHNKRRTSSSGRILLQRAEDSLKPVLSTSEALADFVDDEAGDADATPEKLEIKAEDIAEVKSMEEPQDIILKPRGTGLYRIILESRNKYGIKLEWDEGMPLAQEASLENRINIMGSFIRYFYVPKGTPYVAGYLGTSGAVSDADGKEIFRATGNGDHFKIPVEKGKDGKLWTIRGTSGINMLFTVPSYLFMNGKDLLLPKEVIGAEINEKK